MFVRTSIKRVAIIAFTALLCWTSAAQTAITKSGTTVSPADKPAIPPAPSEKASLLQADIAAGTFIVVATPDMKEALKPFLRWKQQQGFRVETIYDSSNNRDSIRARLRQRYEASSPALPPQKYVLLVGDVDRIPAFSGQHKPAGLNNHATDLYYAEYTGDHLPEAMVGRLSVADTEELANVTAKVIAYEQGLWASDAHSVLLTAGKENRPPAPTTTNGQVRYLAQLMTQYREGLDTVCFYNPASDSLTNSLIDFLGQSNALVNYTAHCTREGWNDPDISFASIDTLGNDVPTLFVNNCCLSNAFNGNCFGESLLRRSTGGAASVIGASNETLWAEDYYWAVGAKYPLSPEPLYDEGLPGAFDGLVIAQDTTFNPDNYSLGAMMQAGCEAVTLAGSPYDAFYYEIYCILGDPSLVPFLGRADTLPLTLDTETIAAGTPSLRARSLPHVRISATQDSLLLGTAMTDHEGWATIHFAIPPHADSLILTATRPEARSHVRTIAVTQPPSARLAVISLATDSASISLKVKNIGGMTALGHHIAIHQDSSEMADGFLLSGNTAIALPQLAPGRDTAIVLPLQGLIVGQEPILSAHLLLSDEADSLYATQPFTLVMPDLRAQLVSMRFLDNEGLPVQELLPNHPYTLELTLSHPADSLHYSFALPSPYLRSDSISATYLFPIHFEDETQHLRWDLVSFAGRWEGHYGGWLIPGRATERFETGNFERYPWQHPSLYPWTIDSTATHEGRFAARSGKIDDGLRSTLTLDIEVLEGDSISFYHKVSCEAHDWLYFYVDGRRTGYWSGQNTWRRYARYLSAGHHKLQWIYEKDASTSQYEDCAYIDDLQLPLATWSEPFGISERDTETAQIQNISAPALRLFPNPAQEVVTLEFPVSQNAHIEFYDALGRKVDEIIIKDYATSTQYSTQHLRLGIYSLVLRTHAGTSIQKMIVTR